MTDDAMDWVWTRARSTGNARVVLLAVAAATTGPEATAPMGNAELRARLGNVSKATVTAAVARALESGELEIAEPGRGSRPALYRLPAAVGHTAGSALEARAQSTGSALETRAQDAGSALETRAQTDGADSALEVRAQSALETRAQTLWDEHPEKCATRTRASSKSICMSERVSEGAPAPAPLTDPIPPFARPLVDRITAAKVYVGWDLTTGEWLRLDAMLKRSGPDMLAEHAVTLARQQEARGERVSSARYFLRAWTNLPPAPTAGTIPAEPTTGPGGDVIPFDRTQPRKGRAAQAADWYAEIIAKEQ